jgi:hypothetical protein
VEGEKIVEQQQSLYQDAQAEAEKLKEEGDIRFVRGLCSFLCIATD